MVKSPASMSSELSAWNGGNGIDLKSWVECVGDFKLAVGYSTIFWPKFVLFEDYILREGFDLQSLSDFEKANRGDKAAVEWVMNHTHIADIHCNDRENLSVDKIVLLGNTLREIHEAKPRLEFPDRPCVVEFYEPDDRKNLMEFQLSFWQKKHEKNNSDWNEVRH
jgi:hypothetical protein